MRVYRANEEGISCSYISTNDTCTNSIQTMTVGLTTCFVTLGRIKVKSRFNLSIVTSCKVSRIIIVMVGGAEIRISGESENRISGDSYTLY
jgi:hypothetical protein